MKNLKANIINNISKTLTKYCFSCYKEGHTYLECKELPLMGMIAASFGIDPEPICGVSKEELEKRIIDKNNRING